MFQLIDFNKNGFLSPDDMHLWVNNIEKELQPQPDAKLIAKLREEMVVYTAAMGLLPGKESNREQFVKDMAAMGVREVAKHKKGEQTLLERVNNAWYDVVDTNHDEAITSEEYQAIAKACNLGDVGEFFKTLDKNKNGKLERKELNDYEFNQWFGLN